GPGHVIRPGGLGRSHQRGDHGCADGSGQLLQGIDDRVAVGVLLRRQLPQSVGHGIPHGKSLAEGKKQIENDNRHRSQISSKNTEATEGDQNGNVSGQNRFHGAEAIQNPAADRRQGSSQETPGQEQAAGDKGSLTGDNLGVVRNQKSQSQTDEL